jgi:ABC-type cobalamin/Fe3+-siderophores transport system ATPase subunit
MSTSALKQYRTELRADLADDVHIVSISGPGGRGKSSLLQNYLSYTNNDKGQCYTQALS